MTVVDPDSPGDTTNTDDATLVDAVAAAVLDEPGVARLSGGPAGAVATYLAGRRVPGVRLTDSAVEVHVVAHWVPSLPGLAGRVRAAVRSVAGGRAVDVIVDDLADREQPVAELTPAAGPMAELPSGEGPGTERPAAEPPATIRPA